MNNNLYQVGLHGELLFADTKATVRKQDAEFIDVNQAALAILREFVQDVEATGPDITEEEWPDLYITYHKARRLLADVDSTKGEPG